MWITSDKFFFGRFRLTYLHPTVSKKIRHMVFWTEFLWFEHTVNVTPVFHRLWTPESNIELTALSELEPPDFCHKYWEGCGGLFLSEILGPSSTSSLWLGWKQSPNHVRCPDCSHQTVLQREWGEESAETSRKGEGKLCVTVTTVHQPSQLFLPR